MASYCRTQILLEGWQHAALKSLAQRLRPRPSGRRGLTAIAGIGRDRKAAGRDHDRWLYGPDGST